MDTHKNAVLTPKGRELSQAAAARQFNTTAKTVGKWVKRFRAEGVDGLYDRSSRPHSSPSQTPSTTSEAVERLRRQRYTGQQIASDLGISSATVGRVLKRLGLNRLSALEPAEPVRRYEREHPGEPIVPENLVRFALGQFRLATAVRVRRIGCSGKRMVSTAITTSARF
jgi:transposase